MILSHQTSVIASPSPHEGKLEPANKVHFPGIGCEYKNFLSHFEFLPKYSCSIISISGQCPQFLADFQKPLELPSRQECLCYANEMTHGRSPYIASRWELVS